MQVQVGNTHATHRAILFKNLNYILKEMYDILSEDALNYPVYFRFCFVLGRNSQVKQTL